MRVPGLRGCTSRLRSLDLVLVGVALVRRLGGRSAQQLQARPKLLLELADGLLRVLVLLLERLEQLIVRRLRVGQLPLEFVELSLELGRWRLEKLLELGELLGAAVLLGGRGAARAQRGGKLAQLVQVATTLIVVALAVGR